MSNAAIINAAWQSVRKSIAERLKKPKIGFLFSISSAFLQTFFHSSNPSGGEPGAEPSVDEYVHRTYAWFIMSSIRAVRKNSGFTIVELLIVIVVIGILAAIVIVAFNGINQTAQKTSTVAEMRQWAKLFELYKAQNGSYPLPAAAPATGGGPGTSVVDRYCLGTGFPQASGTSYCYLVAHNTIYSVAESTGTTLMTELSTVGTPPRNSPKYVHGSVTGPWFRYVSANDQRIGSTFPGGGTCPDGTTLEYSGGGRTDCYIRLQ